MGIAKRPKLATRYTGPRAGPRDFVSLEGRCAVGEGQAEDISVLDLDTGGCRVKGVTVAVTKADVLSLWLGDVGPVSAKMRWAKRGSAGVRFDEALSEEQLDTVLRTAVPAPAPEVIPLRRRIAG